MIYLGSNPIGITETVYPTGIREATIVLDAAATSLVFTNIEAQPYAFMYAYDGDADTISGKYMMLRGAAVLEGDGYRGRQYCNRGGTTYTSYDCSCSYDNVEKTFTINSGVYFQSNVTYKLWYFIRTLN